MTRSKEQINPTLRLLVGSKKQLDEEAVNQNAGLTNRKCIRGRGVLGQGWFFLPQLGPNLINMLNEKGVPTIGFTSFAMDESDIVKSIPDWRSRHLQELGINFNMEKEIVFQIQNGFVPPLASFTFQKISILFRVFPQGRLKKSQRSSVVLRLAPPKFLDYPASWMKS